MLDLERPHHAGCAASTLKASGTARLAGPFLAVDCFTDIVASVVWKTPLEGN